jgi:hypothetical protein
MKESEMIKEQVKEFLQKSSSPNSGEDAAGWANALLMLTKTYGYWLAYEQSTAMNFTGGLDAKRTTDA